MVGWSEPKSSNKEGKKGKVGRRKITKYDKGAEVAIEGPISISEQKKKDVGPEEHLGPCRMIWRR